MAFFDTTWYINFGNGSNTGYYAVPVWPGALTAVTAGTWCRQTSAVGTERCFVCVVAGTTGASEPVWVVTRGADSAANVDGTVKWMECTGMAGPCGDIVNAPTWTTVKNLAVTLGEVIYDSGSGSLQAATTAGTAGNGSTPSFSATAGTTTADNTITWTSLGASSTYTGSPWKYPFARAASAFSATWGAAGNQFFISNNHAETRAAFVSVSPPGTRALPCALLCCTDTAAPPTVLNTTASIANTGASSMGINSTASSVNYFYGITFNCGSGANDTNSIIGTANQIGQGIFDNCVFFLKNTNGQSSSNGISAQGNSELNNLFYNCKFRFSATTQRLNTSPVPTAGTFIGCAFADSGSIPTTLFSNGSGTQFVSNVFQDCDFSTITGTLFTAATGGQPSVYKLQNCKLGSGVTIGAAGSGNLIPYVKLHNCDSAATNYRYSYADGAMTVTQETTIVRTGSLATNGTTPISWNMTTTAITNFYAPAISEEIAQWNDITGSSLTAIIYLISGTTLNNNDFWAELEYLGGTGSLGSLVTSRMTPLATPAALTSDTSTWGGSTNKYKIALTFTPQNKGPVKARFYMAKASQTVYVEPFIYITDATGNLKSSGRSFLIPGLGISNETAPSFMDLSLTGGING